METQGRVMDVAWWTALLTPWTGGLDRQAREVLVRILLENPLEFQVALLIQGIKSIKPGI
jgi:hypothetical protein